MISVDRDKCRKDSLCVQECPFDLIVMAEDGYPAMRPAAAKLCIACGHCVAVCPHAALSLGRITPESCRPIPNGALINLKKLDQLISTRRAIRAYQPQPVARDQIEQLLEVCRWAPSARNSQPVHWLIVENSAEVQRLAGLTVDWLKENGRYPGMVTAWEQGKDMVLRSAPHLAVVHADPTTPKPETDCTIALTLFEVAAQTLALGTCWAGILMSAAAAPHQQLLDALALPEGHRVYGAMMFGHPRFPYFRIPPRKPAAVTWR
ncbi:MAG: nitroreductase family protein [Thermodesulfobacteriota bacterium]